MKLSEYEMKLLQGWEDIHKRSQLSLWIFLALKEGAKHMADIKAFITRLTKGAIEADDKSMYRTLRRFEEADLLTFTPAPSESGPDLKVYSLTETGKRVVQAFLERQIELFYQPAIQKLIKDVS